MKPPPIILRPAFLVPDGPDKLKAQRERGRPEGTEKPTLNDAAALSRMNETYIATGETRKRVLARDAEPLSDQIGGTLASRIDRLARKWEPPVK